MTPDASSSSFEPLFIALAVGAGGLYWRAARLLRLLKKEETGERDLDGDLRRRGRDGTPGEAGPRSSR